MSRCEDCPVSGSLACYCLASGFYHMCGQKRDDEDLVRFIVANSREGAEPGRGEVVRPAAPATVDPRLALVSACPDRGSTLPHTLQPACGCAELTECRASKGTFPGRVTLRDCLDCKSVLTSTP